MREPQQLQGKKLDQVRFKDCKSNLILILKGDDDKYTKEDTPRRIFVKHIDRKKNADDIEDYFFDEYKDTGLEDVYTCTVYNARSQRRMFFGNVILTFDTEANAKVFI